ncbi:MAG: TonB family protein [Gammaproteobacteria bacterium]|nr:TonB family protein [Gammaproteobacteria bacterium]MDH5594293.1 TonB family protein [Gammaproteobacteria bacterium]
MTTLREKPVFFIFLILSLVFHSFFLWQKETTHYDVTDGEDIISVRLEDNTLQILAKKQPEEPVIPLVKNPQPSETKPVQKISKNTQPVVKEEIKTVSKEITKVTQTKIPAPAMEESVASKEQIQRGIKNLFQANFYYPSLARRNNWQGKLEISLRISPDGKLTNIQVTKTSGYSILDDAAIDTLKTANILPLAKEWLNGNHFDMVLPIEYRLVDS